MAKDPAFLFYSQDFLVGTMAMPFDERGRYITLLCYIHQNGPISEETIRLLVGSFSDTLRLKFLQTESGLFFNSRLSLEVEKRAKFTESRILNGNKGGRPKKEKPTDNLNKTYRLLKPKPTENLIEDEDVIDIEILNNSLFAEKLKLIFERWVKYKKDRKEKYKTQDSLNTAFKKLEKFSNGDPVLAGKIIDSAIGNNYAGFFELKVENKNSTTTERKLQL